MARKEPIMPETMTSPETGLVLTRGVQLIDVAYKGKTIVVTLPGYYPDGGGDGVHVGRDMELVDVALRSLKRPPF